MDPETLRYDENHAWVRSEDQTVIIGISDYAQDQLGDIIFVELPPEGEAITAGNPFATLESAKAVQDIIAPVSGEVVACNDELLDVPETINEDPYGAGWLVEVKPEEGFSLDALMTYEQYREMLESEEE